MHHLPLSEMTVAEKLQAMESIWTDLTSKPADVPSPSWHGDVLAERSASVARGDAVAEDWEAAKRSIRQHLT